MLNRRMIQMMSHQVTVWLVLAVSLLLTALAWQLSENFVSASVAQRFEFQKLEISSGITRRLQEYQAALRGGAGLINASDHVRGVEWQRYVASLRLAETFPGIVALGYAPLIEPGRRVEFLRDLEADVLQGARIVPAGERPRYVPVRYVEMLDAAVEERPGFDLLADPGRREALEKAAANGEPALSGRFVLRDAGGGEQPGFMIALPVFPPGESSDGGRRVPVGYVFAVLRAQPFIAGTFLGDLRYLDLELFDGSGHAAESLMFANLAADAPAVDDSGETIDLRAGQRDWSLHVAMRAGYRTPSETTQPLIIAAGGLAVDLLLFFLVWSVGRRKQQLEQISDALAEQVEESEAMLRSAIETIGEAFVVYDAADRLVYFNERYREIYRKSAPMIEIGRSFEEILRYGVACGEYAEVTGDVEAWIAERVARHRRDNSETIQRLSNGRWLRIREGRTASGHIVGFRVDVSEFYRATEAAEAASRAKSQFLATVSHEIRTPMNGVLGMAQILLNPELPQGEREDCAYAILRSGQTLLALLNDILDLSKIEAGKFELQPVAFSPVDLLREAVELFAEPARRKSLTVRWQTELADSVRYVADAMRLRQMLSNLLGNAVKFTAQGEIVLSVAAQPDAEGGTQLEFAVDDSGVGIPEERRRDLFEPFSQLDGGVSRQFGGTGLGLSIVRNLARLMGGDAGVDARPGGGSRFWFRIAVAPIAAETRVAVAPRPAKGLPHLAGRVLVAEDDRINRLVVVGALQKAGAQVRAVEDGQLAVAAIEAGQRFDLILMDISMPVLDGIAATELIREHLRAAGEDCPPVVAITANAFPEDRERCVAAGMADFLAKPVDFRELGRLLERYLQAPEPPETAPVAEAQAAAADRERVVAIVRRLLPLLVQHKFDAFAVFKELKSAVAGTGLAADVDELGELLNRMAFDQVVERLHELVESSGSTLRE